MSTQKWETHHDGDHMVLTLDHEKQYVIIDENPNVRYEERGGMCSYQDFREGQFHELIKRRFGEEIFREAVLAVGEG